MKFKNLLFKTMPIVVLSTSLMPCIVACNVSGVPTVSSHEVRKAFINTLSKTSSGRLYYVTSEYGQVEVHHFNGSSIGYINVDDYVNFAMQFADRYESEKYTNYHSETKDYKTTIKNLYSNATCVIDYKKQTITFSDYDVFLTMENTFADNPLAHGAGGGEVYFVPDASGHVYQNSNYVSGGTYTIDLSKYNLIAYYDGGKGYLPYDVFRNIINNDARYHLFYNGVNFYEISTGNNINTIDLYDTIRAESKTLNKEYLEYCYNILALTLDNRFGLTERLSRAAATRGQIKKFFPYGAYTALAPYKEALTSLEPDVANDALFAVFANLCDDGGHAGYRGLDLLSTRPHKNYFGPETAEGYEVMDMMNEARENALLQYKDEVAPKDYWVNKFGFEEDSAPDNYMKLYKKQASDERPILYITFDSFNHVEQYTTYREWRDNKVYYDDVKLSEGTNPGNYYLDTIRMTMGADRFIKEYNQSHTVASEKINDLVIDLSDNGGGTVYTEYFIASWLCGGVEQKVYNPHTKAYSEFKIQADVNGDTKFDENDYLPSTMNVYVITSDNSFSCGNALPCNIVDNRSAEHTKYIGTPSGGGACFVDGNMAIGMGNVFRSSSNFHILRKGSTKDNPISAESGHLADQASKFMYYIASTWDDCYKFTDRATINAKIWAA